MTWTTRGGWSRYSFVILPVALALGVAGTAEGQPKPKPQPAPAPSPAPPPAPPPTSVRGKPAIARIAEDLARDLASAPRRALVVAGPPASDVPAPKGAQLAAALAAQLAGRRGAGSRAQAEPSSLATARGAAHAEGTLVYLTVEIAAGQVRVAADVYPVPRTVWARIRDPEPGPRAHAFAQAPIDAEVRTFLAPVPLTAFAPVRAKNFESDVVALACGDLEEDGALEIVSVSRRRVTTLRLQGGKVLPLQSKSWPDLVGVAPAPLREPIGFASVSRRAAGGAPDDVAALLDVGLTDRAKSVRLDARLRVLSTFGGIAVPDGDATACTRLSALVVTGPVAACMTGDPAPLTPSIGGQYDAFASARLVSPRGAPLHVWVGRERGVVELRDDAGHRQTLDGAGAQLAVGDLDQDGDVEVISSLDVQNPLEDAVVIRSWSASQGGKLREIGRLPAAAGVHALAVCPPDGAGRAAFVVATLDEIWVVR